MTQESRVAIAHSTTASLTFDKCQDSTREVSIIWDKKVAGFCTAVPYLLLPAVAAPPQHWTGGEEGQQ